MKQCIVLLLILSVILGCKRETSASVNAQQTEKLPEISYNDYLKQIRTLDEKGKRADLFHYINYDVPKYWAGTKWDFNGTTEQPGNGTIACGFFVTTVLHAYGWDIKKNYLAQQPSSVMIKQLRKEIKHFRTVDDLSAYLDKQSNRTAYLVGLDFHTGFITKEVADQYFIHSSYIGKKGITKEKVQQSAALKDSKSFMLGKLIAWQ